MPGTRRTLADRYRALLFCYPRRYRRERGGEIVDTLLDLAGPDRARPTVAEAANLVRHGLRCRLGRANSRTVVVWAALTAVVWGLFAGALATRAAWETARPLPGQTEATALFSRVLGRDVTGPVFADPALFVIFGEPLGWHNAHLLLSFDASEFGPGQVAATLNGPSGTSGRGLLDPTRASLRANGFRLSEVTIRDRTECSTCDRSTLPKEAVFVAWRGDDVLEFEISLGDPRPYPPKPGISHDETYFHAALTRATPPAVYPLGILGALLGAVFGWMVFGWASRRTEGHHPLVSRLAAILFGSALFLWCAPVAIAVPSLATHTLREPHPSWHPMWEWLGQPGLAALFVVGTGAGLLALAASALPHRRSDPEPISA